MVSRSVLEMGRAGAEEHDMSKADTYKRIAVCPFFDTAFERSVRCESPEPESNIRLTFRTSAGCHAYIKRACASQTGCRECVIYRALQEKNKKS